ncbi:MAG: hypothetical protein NDJ89_05790 [Oligoflexia bacterium]|nr:hypothetical protein [Oligoflexia bacterium]
MQAAPPELDRLAELLWQKGIAAFCPTTLSAPSKELHEVVSRLGEWIRRPAEGTRGALPLGIHLEGPFLHPEAIGAHPPEGIRPLTPEELRSLWEASQGTLKILTMAPETLEPAVLRDASRFCRKKGIVLSLGHSRASEAEARAAFDQGFRGVTHAWNALGFHHRAPGPLGAALGRPDVYIELIPDQIHLSPTLIRWTRRLHAGCPICFVSDATPAAATDTQSKHGFGPLTIQLADGASRLESGALAGGGMLLSESFGRWVTFEARATGQEPEKVLKSSLDCVTRFPLAALGLDPAVLLGRKVLWRKSRNPESYRPIPEL